MEVFIRLGPRNHNVPKAYPSSSLDCFLQCELYRVLNRQRPTFLPSVVEGSVISQGRAGRSSAPVMSGTFIWRQRRSDLLAQSLGGAPDAGGSQRAAESSAHCRQSLQCKG